MPTRRLKVKKMKLFKLLTRCDSCLTLLVHKLEIFKPFSCIFYHYTLILHFVGKYAYFD